MARRGKGRKRSRRSAAGSRGQREIAAWLAEAAALHRAGRVRSALALYEAVLERDPRCADALHLTGVAAHQQGDHLEAARRIEQALSRAPDRPAYLASLGAVYLDLGRPSAAAAVLERALRHDPAHAEALYNLGLCHRSLGRFREAEGCWRRLLELRPEDTTVLRLLASLRPLAAGDPLFARLQELAGRADLPVQGRVDCWFALGQAWERLGDTDRAFACFAAGNREKRASFHYDLEDDRRLFAAVAGEWDAEVVAAGRPAGEEGEGPVVVFIVGMPRSGTTLVEQVLAAHSRVAALGEVEVVPRLLRGPYARVTGESFPAGAGQVGGGTAAGLAAWCRDAYRCLAPGAGMVTDKLPHNFLHLGLLARLLPEARFVHCVRHPLDTCLSCYCTDFARLHRWAYDLEEIGGYWLLYRRLMTHWQQVLGERLFEVSYEELVGDFEPAARRLLAHCGLAWEDGCREFHRVPRPVHTASAIQVRRRLYRTSAGRWRRYAEHLGPLRRLLPDETPLSENPLHILFRPI